jgi:hypothetical protein
MRFCRAYSFASAEHPPTIFHADLGHLSAYANPRNRIIPEGIPSSVFVDGKTVICADGCGTLHVMTMSSMIPHDLLESINSRGR